MSSDIVQVRLINGDELVTRCIHEDDECYIFGSPMLIEERINSTTGATVTVLVKYVQLNSTQEIEISKNHVIVVAPIDPIYERYYNISRTYNEKYVQPNALSEIEKVTSAMEDLLFSPPKPNTEIKIKSTSNNTIH